MLINSNLTKLSASVLLLCKFHYKLEMENLLPFIFSSSGPDPLSYHSDVCKGKKKFYNYDQQFVSVCQWECFVDHMIVIEDIEDTVLHSFIFFSFFISN